MVLLSFQKVLETHTYTHTQTESSGYSVALQLKISLIGTSPNLFSKRQQFFQFSTETCEDCSDFHTAFTESYIGKTKLKKKDC